MKSNSFNYVLTTDTKGYAHFWDILNYVENCELETIFAPKYKYCLHQSGINCCDWLELEKDYCLLATGGDDQCLSLSVFECKDKVEKLFSDSISVHCSQITGNVCQLFICIILGFMTFLQVLHWVGNFTKTIGEFCIYIYNFGFTFLQKLKLFPCMYGNFFLYL